MSKDTEKKNQRIIFYFLVSIKIYFACLVKTTEIVVVLGDGYESSGVGYVRA